ncbi:MAG: alanyl-tRNA editing protein [Clostridiales bacterium]|nr:alanyl-tRNA editing protein [Clostridiales bacterium]
MKTKRLFKENPYLVSSEAMILESLPFEDHTAVILDRTVFFPEGGGQPWDLGRLTIKTGSCRSYAVIKVIEHEGEILHVLDTSDAVPVNSVCLLELDWQRRFDSMQRHTGEHIFTGVFDKLFGGTNRGFHMGDDYMTIDIALEDRAKVDTITWDMVKEAELRSNEIIYKDMPMIVRHFDSFEEASKEPMRKPLTIEEDITLVGFGSTDYDWACVACCGTHLKSTAQVGLIKAFKLESNKGMYRIYFEAGRRAFIKYQEEMETLHTLGRKMSAGTDDILSKYDAQTEKNKEKSFQLSMLKKEVVSRECDRIVKALADNAYEDLPCERYSILTLDDLTQLGRALSPSIKKVFFLVHEPSTTVLLVSDGKNNCGKLVKENASIYNGKGGGNDILARAIFTKTEYVDTFMDLIEKHLR